MISLLSRSSRSGAGSRGGPGFLYRPSRTAGRSRYVSRERDDFPDLLRQVREWIAGGPDSIWRRYLGSELFATVAGIFDTQTRQVIEEYLSEPDEIKMNTVSTEPALKRTCRRTGRDW